MKMKMKIDTKAKFTLKMKQKDWNSEKFVTHRIDFTFSLISIEYSDEMKWNKSNEAIRSRKRGEKRREEKHIDISKKIMKKKFFYSWSYYNEL